MKQKHVLLISLVLLITVGIVAVQMKKTDGTGLLPALFKEQAAVIPAAAAGPIKRTIGDIEYTTANQAIVVTQSSTLFDLDAQDFKTMADSCKTKVDSSRISTVLSSFKDINMTAYRFSLTEGEEKGSYTITTMPNSMHYNNLVEFKSDFDVCTAKAALYPYMATDTSLLFIGSCDDETRDTKENSQLCMKIKTEIEGSLSIK